LPPAFHEAIDLCLHMVITVIVEADQRERNENMKLDVKNGNIQDQSILKSRYASKDDVQGLPMIGLSVGSFIQLISMDQQTCLVEVYHKENRRGVFYFIEGDLYNAQCGDLEGEEAAMEMISWEEARININTNANMNGIARKIEKGLLSLLMESSRRRDEADWEKRLKTLEEVVQDNEEVFNALNAQSDETTSPSNNFEMKFRECIELCKRNMGDALLAAVILSMPDGRALGGFRSNSETVSLFNSITASIRSVLENDSSEALGRYYILDLEHDKTLFSFSLDKYKCQWGVLFDSGKVKPGLFLNVIVPKVIRIFEEPMTISKSGSGSVRNISDDK
jgi:hypothetical protein